jgi:hypothetical protein
MKKISRKVVLILFTSFLGICATAVYADRIQYSYDASGNRTSMQVISLRGTESSSDSINNSRRHNLTDHIITIYPNPTEGELKVEISSFETVGKASVAVYSNIGNVVYYNAEPTAINEISLSSCADGMYLLVIMIDGETNVWKVIKN